MLPLRSNERDMTEDARISPMESKDRTHTLSKLGFCSMLSHYAHLFTWVEAAMWKHYGSDKIQTQPLPSHYDVFPWEWKIYRILTNWERLIGFFCVCVFALLVKYSADLILHCYTWCPCNFTFWAIFFQRTQNLLEWRLEISNVWKHWWRFTLLAMWRHL